MDTDAEPCQALVADIDVVNRSDRHGCARIGGLCGWRARNLLHISDSAARGAQTSQQSGRDGRTPEILSEHSNPLFLSTELRRPSNSTRYSSWTPPATSIVDGPRPLHRKNGVLDRICEPNAPNYA
jgi:hypothetical protein